MYIPLEEQKFKRLLARDKKRRYQYLRRQRANK